MPVADPVCTLPTRYFPVRECIHSCPEVDISQDDIMVWRTDFVERLTLNVHYFHFGEWTLNQVLIHTPQLLIQSESSVAP